MSLTRRQLALSLGAAGLLAPTAARADLSALEAAARKEGSVTWYVAQMSGEAAEAIAWGEGVSGERAGGSTAISASRGVWVGPGAGGVSVGAAEQPPQEHGRGGQGSAQAAEPPPLSLA